MPRHMVVKRMWEIIRERNLTVSCSVITIIIDVETCNSHCLHWTNGKVEAKSCGLVRWWAAAWCCFYVLMIEISSHDDCDDDGIINVALCVILVIITYYCRHHPVWLSLLNSNWLNSWSDGLSVSHQWTRFSCRYYVLIVMLIFQCRSHNVWWADVVFM